MPRPAAPGPARSPQRPRDVAATMDDAAPRLDQRPAEASARRRRSRPGLTAVPVTFVLTLLLVCTSRWGSYLGPPGVPVYIGDVLVVLALVQVALVLRRDRSPLRGLPDAPLVLLVSLAVLVAAALRFVAGRHLGIDALRDVAPYGYAVVALLAYLLPARGSDRVRRWIYAVLAVHAAWVVLLPHVPGFPWGLPVLGSDAVLLVARPDFDTAVLGVGLGLVLSDLLRRPGLAGRERAGLAVLGVVSAYGILSGQTRAGFLAALAVLAAVVGTWLAGTTGRRPTGAGSRSHRRRAVAVTATLLVVAAAVVATPIGSRLVQGFSSGSSQASGTVAVRREVWRQVGSYVLRDAQRTAVGVGFGPNFIAASGSRAALEGTEYTNVRSPHNYLLGTLARLGVGGALLVAVLLLLGWAVAVPALRASSDAVTVLAAGLAIALPVTALLGVVLESPFGALPWFWALGQLAATRRSAPALPPPGRAPDAVGT